MTVYGRNLILMTISSIVLYSVAVSSPATTLCAGSVSKGYLSLQGLQYTLITVSGLGMGLTTSRWLIQGMQSFFKSLAYRHRGVNLERKEWRLAVIILVTGTSLNTLFLSLGFNQFVDLHKGLSVEMDILLFAMGVFMGVAWVILLRQNAWWGLFASTAMSLMIMSNTLAAHSWPS